MLFQGDGEDVNDCYIKTGGIFLDAVTYTYYREIRSVNFFSGWSYWNGSVVPTQ
jgi:hypothetical protein